MEEEAFPFPALRPTDMLGDLDKASTSTCLRLIIWNQGTRKDRCFLSLSREP